MAENFFKIPENLGLESCDWEKIEFPKNPGLESCDWEKIEKLLEACKLVDPKYIKCKYEEKLFNELTSHGHNIEGIENQVERSFAYELYHQLRLLLNEDFAVNAEVQKIVEFPLSPIDEEFLQTDRKPTEESSSRPNFKRFYPDIIIHKSQGNVKGQYVICEIKRGNNLGRLIEDIEKLQFYIGCLKFRIGVIIGINCTPEEFKDALKEETIKEIPINQEKILCIVVTDDGKVYYQLLKDLIKKTEQ